MTTRRTPTPTKFSKSFIVRVTPMFHHRLKVIASRVGCSMSDLAREALRSIFNKKEGK